MFKKINKNSKTYKKLFHKFRLVVLNEDTFEERFSFKLTRVNVFVLLMLSAIVLVALTSLIIAYSPLKEYIPGYSSSALKKEAVYLRYKADSLQQILNNNDAYFLSIKKVLKGEVKAVTINKDSVIKAAAKDVFADEVHPTKADSILREKVNKEDKYNVFETATTQANFVLFPPVNGAITEPFNPKNKHFAVDVSVVKNTPVKSAADGTVIFSEWTAETGFVIIIEHSLGLISVYKHNASITKMQGDLVKAGEVIAIAGNTGEYSTGPHLHFELWSDGYPVNPTNFIAF